MRRFPGEEIEVLKRLALTQILKIVISPARIALPLGLGPYDDKLIPVWIRKRSEENSPNHAEDCHIRTDAKCQSQHRNGRETWISSPLTKAVAQVVNECRNRHNVSQPAFMHAHPPSVFSALLPPPPCRRTDALRAGHAWQTADRASPYRWSLPHGAGSLAAPSRLPRSANRDCQSARPPAGWKVSRPVR